MKRAFLILLTLMILLLLGGCTQPEDKNTAEPIKPPTAVETPGPEEPPAPAIPTENLDEESVVPAPVVRTPTLSWYFIRNDHHQVPQTNAQYLELLGQHQAFYSIPNESNKIYLTFDCGYELGYTGQILDTLADKGIKAAFFITGQYIETQPDLVKRMHTEGHLVCNHSYHHPDFSTISQTQLNQEISSLEESYRNLTGLDMDKYLRPPMGNFNASSLKWTKELGYATVFWSMAWKDWDPQQQPGADYVYQHVMDNIHPGAVILMHAVSQSDTQALDRIISDLQAQGYVFSTFGN